MATCLYCYEETGPYEGNYHLACAKRMFKTYPPPHISFTTAQLTNINNTQPHYIIEKRRGINGHRNLHPTTDGTYIIKPATDKPKYVPELENLCLKLASESGIHTVLHSLLEDADNDLVLVVKPNTVTIPLQPTSTARMASYEQMVHAIEKQSVRPGLDKVLFAERLVFAFLTGDATISWANTLLYQSADDSYVLAPLQTATSTALLQPALAAELNLQLAGRTSNITEQTFDAFFEKIGINKVAAGNIKRRFSNSLRYWFNIVEMSFLPEKQKRNFILILIDRAERLNMM